MNSQTKGGEAEKASSFERFSARLKAQLQSTISTLFLSTVWTTAAKYYRLTMSVKLYFDIKQLSIAASERGNFYVASLNLLGRSGDFTTVQQQLLTL